MSDNKEGAACGQLPFLTFIVSLDGGQQEKVYL